MAWITSMARATCWICVKLSDRSYFDRRNRPVAGLSGLSKNQLMNIGKRFAGFVSCTSLSNWNRIYGKWRGICANPEMDRWNVGAAWTSITSEKLRRWINNWISLFRNDPVGVIQSKYSTMLVLSMGTRFILQRNMSNALH
jgi:hypothetical protein